MNNELQNTLNELITKAMNSADVATGFLLSEVPDVVNQILLWHGVKSFLVMFVFIAILAINVFLILVCASGVKQNKGYSWNEQPFPEELIYGTVLLSAFVIPSSIIFILNNLDWLQILIAPKLYLIEYAATLIK